jgi:transposase-like protein
MTNQTKYGLLQFRKQYATEYQCLKAVFEANHSYQCSCGGEYTPLYGRRQFQCSKCRFQIAPTAGTIFQKSDTPLTLWFFAIFLFSNAKSGYSAKQLQRDLGVTYKTAWRMLKLIRQALPEDNDFLSGIVETDTAYMGGRHNAGKNNQNLSDAIAAKSVVMGAVERGGNVRVKVSPDAKARSIYRFLDQNVNPITSTLMTDKSRSYLNAAKNYNRFSVDHSKKEYVRGKVYVNTMDAFWSHVKRSICGTHKVVSKKYLQSYLDGFAFHYNMRRSDIERFSALLGTLMRVSG